MLEEIKTDLRITHNKLDSDINENISAALAFIENAGVITDMQKPLIKRCVKNYCRWQYDYNSQGELWRVAFEELLKTLSLSEEYRA